MNEGVIRTETTGVIGNVAVVRNARVSWSAIIAGAVVALALWALLYVFGMAAGLTMIDPNDPSSARAAGIGTGVWSLVSPLIALFLGGLFAARLAGPITRGNGALHGAVLWGLTALVGAFLLTSIIGSLISGAAGVAKQTVVAATGLASAAGGATAEAGRTLGIDTQDLLGPVNEKLRAAGKPPLTADQLQAAARDAATTAVRQGRIDQETLVSSIASKTTLDRADAQQLANQIEQRWQSVKDEGQAQLQRAEAGALAAADKTGKVLWGAFGALLLGMIAAVIGGVVGAHPVGGAASQPRATSLRPSFGSRPDPVHP